MEKIIPKDCPYFEGDEKEPVLFYCTIIEDYIVRFFSFCTTQNYDQCEHYIAEIGKRREKVIE